MTSRHSIVPAQPVTVRLQRRRKTWTCAWLTFLLALVSLGLMGTRFPDDTAVPAWIVMTAVAVTALCGAAALWFRFTEQPCEIEVRRYPSEGPVIHFGS